MGECSPSCCGWRAGLQYPSEPVGTPIAQLHSLSEEYSWEDYRGALGEMFFVWGNGYGESSSNLERGWLHFT